jgi:hypothetical protein
LIAVRRGLQLQAADEPQHEWYHPSWVFPPKPRMYKWRYTLPKLSIIKTNGNRTMILANCTPVLVAKYGFEFF